MGIDAERSSDVGVRARGVAARRPDSRIASSSRSRLGLPRTRRHAKAMKRQPRAETSCAARARTTGCMASADPIASRAARATTR